MNYLNKFLCTIIFISLTQVVIAQPTSIADPSGTSIAENDPTYSCPAPYENVPIGRSTGKTLVFTNATWPSNIKFGAETLIEDLINGNYTSFPPCTGLADVNFSSGSSNLANGVAVYTGLTTFPVIGSTAIRLTLTFKENPSLTAIALDNLSFPAYILMDVPGNFQVNILIEANNTTNGVSEPSTGCPSGGTVPLSFQPVVDLFDRIGCLGTTCKPTNASICTSFDRSNEMKFYSTISVYTFEGTIDDDWTKDGNWDVGVAPSTPFDGDIIIDAACIANEIGSFTFLPSSTMTINANKSLKIISSSSMLMQGMVSNLGTFDAGNMIFSNTFENDGTLIGTEFNGDVINKGIIKPGDQ